MTAAKVVPLESGRYGADAGRRGQAAGGPITTQRYRRNAGVVRQRGRILLMRHKHIVHLLARAAVLPFLLTFTVGLWAAPPKLPPLTPKPYPSDKCLVSGEKLGSMGKPYVEIIDDREYKFCCSGCVKDVKQDPKRFAALHDAAWKKVKPYPLTTCVVSDEKLGSMGKPVGFVVKGQEVRLCCKGCRKDFDKSPEKFLKKLVGKAR